MDEITPNADLHAEEGKLKTKPTRKESKFVGVLPRTVPISSYNTLASIIVSISVVFSMLLLYLMEREKHKLISSNHEQCMAGQESCNRQ